MPINRRNPIPAYYQLKQLLKEQIEQGRLKPGDQLPTEAELCERYQLSRTPVRQALQELVFEGLLTRTPGRGTFVAQPSDGRRSELQTLRVVLSDDRWREPLERALAVWHQDHPEVQLQLEITLVPLNKLRAHLVEAVGRGEAPDISLLDSVWVAEFASRHYLMPLTEIEPSWSQAHEQSMFPALLAANCWDRTIHGVPISADITVIWYRRDWFEAEGLSPPATWDDLVAAGRYFQRPTVRERYGLGRYPLVFVGGRRGGETTLYQLLPFLWSAGGALIHNNAVVLDSPQNRRALAFLTALVQTEELAPPEVVDFSWDEATSLFAQERAAMAIGGTYESFFIRASAGWDESAFLDRVGFIPIPAGPDGQQTTLVGGMSFVIYRQAQFPRQSLALLDRANTSQSLLPFCRRTGHHPPRIDTVRELVAAGDRFLSPTAPLLEIARPRPSTPDFARVSEQFQILVEDCLTGRRRAGEALPRCAELIAAITGLPLRER